VLTSTYTSSANTSSVLPLTENGFSKTMKSYPTPLTITTLKPTVTCPLFPSVKVCV